MAETPITSLADPHTRQLSVPSPPAKGDFRHPQIRGSLVERHEPLVKHALSVSHFIIHRKSSGQRLGAEPLLVALDGILLRDRLVCGLGGLVGITTGAAL